MVCAQFNNGAIKKGSSTNELVRPNKKFEYEEVVPNWNHWEKTYTLNNSCKYTKALRAFSNKIFPDILFFTDGLVVQCYFTAAKNIIIAFEWHVW